MDPNHVKIFSPDGEMFEMSRANARDLVTHAGWSVEAPATTPTTAKDTNDGEGTDEGRESGSAEDGVRERGEEERREHDEASEGDEGSDEAQEGLKLNEEDFADLAERDDVVAYLAKHFPEYKPHHLAKRETLIAAAIEMAKAK